MSWIIISKACHDCGGETSFEICDDKPTSEQIRYVEKEIGGMGCIETIVKEIEEGINTIKNN